MYCEDLIAKALAANKLYLCVVGAGEYYLASRDEDRAWNTNYETLLFSFDRYDKKYPGANLKEKYEQTLERLLASQKPAQVYVASKCILTQISMERKPGFDFGLSDKYAFLRATKTALERNRQGIIEYICAVSMGDIGDNMYNSVLDRIMEEMKGESNA